MRPDEISLVDPADAARRRRRWIQWVSVSMLGLSGAASYWLYQPAVYPLYFDGRFAYAHASHPPEVHAVVNYCNQIQGKPYVWGGGHRELFAEGYDCSGSISHVLYRAGLLQGPLNSRGFATYGARGPGRYISLFVKPGRHVFMSVCGLRFDTSGDSESEGPAWRRRSRDPSGFINRHPPGL